MTIATATKFLDRLEKYKLLEQSKICALRHKLHQKPRSLLYITKKLIAQEWLTPFQVWRILNSQSSQLRLGSYVLLDQLGQGGMCEVFKARHRKLGLIVALKCLRIDDQTEPVLIDRFRRESAILLKLAHHNVVRAFHSREFPSTHFIALEYVDGQNLGTKLREEGPLPVGKACDFIRQAALGLQHAHEHSIIHRDVKPSNLLWSNRYEPDQIKVSDLGLAKMQDSSHLTPLTALGVIPGSADFVAPEQTTSPSSIDNRADIYSLGCTFYTLLTGRPPFPGGTVIDKAMRHRVEMLPYLDHVGPRVNAVIQQMTAKKPEQRYPTMHEVTIALEKLLSNPDELLPFDDEHRHPVTVETNLDMMTTRVR